MALAPLYVMDYYDEPIHICVPASNHDPRNPPPELPGVVIHYVPDLHPDDKDVIRGMPVTSLARTLIDLAEEMTHDELLDVFWRAWELGDLDIEKVRASRGRVEWRASLALFDEVFSEFLRELS